MAEMSEALSDSRLRSCAAAASEAVRVICCATQAKMRKYLLGQDGLTMDMHARTLARELLPAGGEAPVQVLQRHQQLRPQLQALLPAHYDWNCYTCARGRQRT